MDREDVVRASFERQALACEDLGSPFTARLAVSLPADSIALLRSMSALCPSPSTPTACPIAAAAPAIPAGDQLAPSS